MATRINHSTVKVSDAAVTITRVNISEKFDLYPKVEETREAITYACHVNKSNPVLDYFDSLKWDGKPRLNKLLIRCHKGRPSITGYTRPVSFGPPEHRRPSHEPIPPISDVGKPPTRT